MGDVAVENPANTVPPHNKPSPSTIPNVESIEGLPAQGGDDYATLKKLQRHLEYIQLQEEYIKDEQRCAQLLNQPYKTTQSDHPPDDTNEYLCAGA